MFMPEPYVQVPLVAALLTEAGAWLLRHRAQAHHSLGEEARRLAMVMNGFGEAKESTQAIDLRAKTGTTLLQAAEALDNPGYYASTAPHGRWRLVEMLDESSFWSKHLYRAAAVESLWLSGFVVVALLIAVLLAAPFTDASTTLVVSRAAVIVLSVLITVDELGTALGWLHSAEAAASVNAQLERVDADTEPLLLTLFADYSVAAATAAPIPERVYKREQARLNELWCKRRPGT